MVKARKTMRHLKKKGKMGKKGASRVGKSARRRTTKHQRRTRRRMKLRGGMNRPAEASGSPPPPAPTTPSIEQLKNQVATMEEKVKEIGKTKFKCTPENVEG